MVAGGGMYGCRGACMVVGGHAWLLGGMHGCCGGGVHGCWGHVWLWGMCMVVGGVWLQGACIVAGGHAWLWGACMVVGGGHAWWQGGVHGIQ